ncbi:MAG: hypothetical protein ACYDDF_09240 [Thermoplasmatota archaeon]
MLIREPKPNFEQVKEVKVKIPVGIHIKLHSMKVLTGKQISDAVTEALGEYFHVPVHPVDAPSPAVPAVPAVRADGVAEGGLDRTEPDVGADRPAT